VPASSGHGNDETGVAEGTAAVAPDVAVGGVFTLMLNVQAVRNTAVATSTKRNLVFIHTSLQQKIAIARNESALD
jgi:hypothetical protein